MTSKDTDTSTDRQPGDPPQIAARVHVDAKTGTMWVLGYPSDCETEAMQDGDGAWHNCDAMGCGSAGMHVLAIVTLWNPEVERLREVVRSGGALLPKETELLARADGWRPASEATP